MTTRFLFPLRFMFEAVQRGIDITISALSLIALAPLLALITLLIRLTSQGPAFFIQPRMGRYGVGAGANLPKSLHLTTDITI